MIRQRLRWRSFPVARAGADAVVVILALALMWGGAMLVLLACKVSPETIDALSGYHSAYDYLANLKPEDISASTRLITAIAGLLAFVIFGYLAWHALPRPYLARTDRRLVGDERGNVHVNARAIERAAEIAVVDHPAVVSAHARYATDDLMVHIAASAADALAVTLTDVHQRARDSLARHELPPLPVNVTLVRFEHDNPRKLQ